MNFLKPVSLITAVCFLISSLCPPYLHAGSLSSHPGNNLQSAAESLLVPSSVGKVTSSRYFGSDTVVINIQDLHCHPEVQRNISRMLETLDGQYHIRNVFVEGGYGDVDTSWLAGMKDQKLKKDIADTLVDEGKLTGVEYYSICNNKPHLLKGLDDEKLHKDNIARLGKILSRQEAYEQLTKKLTRDLGFIQTKYFNTLNRRFNKILSRYRSGDMPADKYYSLLAKYIQKINNSPDSFNDVFGISMDKYPNIKGYLEILETGKRINYKRVSVELQEFLQVLKSKLPYSAYNFLLKKTDNFSKMDVLYDCLSSLSVEYRLTQNSDFPHLQQFFKYIEKSRNINPIELIREERKLTEEIRIALSEDVGELEVSFLVDFFGCFEDYLGNRLSAGDYDYFVARFDRFKYIWGKYSSTNRLNGIADDFPLLDAFYKTNVERNQCFIKNMAVSGISAGNPDNANDTGSAEPIEMLKKSKDVVIVVTGGFHTEGLERLLEEKHLSYLAITPNVTQDTKTSSAVYLELAKHQSRVLSNALQLTIASEQSSSELLRMMAGALWQRAGLENPGIATGEVRKTLEDMGYTDVNATIDKDNKRITINFTEPAHPDLPPPNRKQIIVNANSPAETKAGLQKWLASPVTGDTAGAAAAMAVQVLRAQTVESFAAVFFPGVVITEIMAAFAEKGWITGDGLIYDLAAKSLELKALTGLDPETLANMPEWCQDIINARKHGEEALLKLLSENDSAFIHALLAIDLVRRMTAASLASSSKIESDNLLTLGNTYARVERFLRFFRLSPVAEKDQGVEWWNKRNTDGTYEYAKLRYVTQLIAPVVEEFGSVYDPRGFLKKHFNEGDSTREKLMLTFGVIAMWAARFAGAYFALQTGIDIQRIAAATALFFLSGMATHLTYNVIAIVLNIVTGGKRDVALTKTGKDETASEFSNDRMGYEYIRQLSNIELLEGIIEEESIDTRLRIFALSRYALQSGVSGEDILKKMDGLRELANTFLTETAKDQKKIEELFREGSLQNETLIMCCMATMIFMQQRLNIHAGSIGGLCRDISKAQIKTGMPGPAYNNYFFEKSFILPYNEKSSVYAEPVLFPAIAHEITHNVLREEYGYSKPFDVSYGIVDEMTAVLAEDCFCEIFKINLPRRKIERESLHMVAAMNGFRTDDVYEGSLATLQNISTILQEYGKEYNADELLNAALKILANKENHPLPADQMAARMLADSLRLFPSRDLILKATQRGEPLSKRVTFRDRLLGVKQLVNIITPQGIRVLLEESKHLAAKDWRFLSSLGIHAVKGEEGIAIHWHQVPFSELDNRIAETSGLRDVHAYMFNMNELTKEQKNELKLKPSGINGLWVSDSKNALVMVSEANIDF